MSNKALEQGEGILRLAPAWVPRSFCIPGKRIKLHPDDLYAFGANRGGIDERWFSSTTKADNGPLTTPDEGLSYVVWGDGQKPQKTLFKDVIAELGAELLGDDDVERVPRLADVLQVLRQQGRRCPTTSTRWRSTPRRVGHGIQARSLLLPPPAEQLRRRRPLHLLRPGAGHDQGPGAPLPGDLEPGRQPHHRPVEGLSAGAGHRLVRAGRHPARARQPVHLRAAVGQRRLRHVPVAGERSADRLGAAGEERAAGARSTTWTT